MFKFVTFSKKQKKTLNWWTSSSPARDYDGIIAEGAIRSGKTLCMSLSFVMWAMSNYNGYNFGLCGKTIESFRRNVVKPLKQALDATGYEYEEKRSENILLVRYGTHENTFYIFGGKDEASQDLVQGITLAGVFFDEVALMPESFVNQATARCSVEGSKLWFNCNPAGPHHWFKVGWVDRAKERRLLKLHFTMDDNNSLSERIKERYRSQYTGVFYKRYILGEWALAEGVIYDMFDEEVMTVDPTGYEYTPAAYVSCDYGTQNATVFLLWQKTKQGVWICTREYYYSGRSEEKQKTDAEYRADLFKWLNGIKPRAMIVDPSAASFIAELRKHGITVIKAKNDVLDGIRNTGTQLNAGTIKVGKNCKHTIAEFHEYTWDDKAAAGGVDRPVKINDHCMDALRYFVHTVLAVQKATVGDKRKLGVR